MENLLPLALSYLNRGWNVIPVGLEKKPLIAWKEYQDRKVTVDELVSWFTFFPDAQIGIVTGKISDLTVIDVESDGDFTLIKEPTYVVETGGKGRHYYFKYEDGFKNSVRVLPSVDVRSEGGYVIAAGSKTFKGGYTVLKDVETAKMSSLTRNTFQGATRRVLDANTPEVTGGKTSYPRISTEGLVYEGAGEGSRNDSMAKFAGSIHAKLHPSLWSTIGWNLFESANSKNTPPLGQRELVTTWESIGRLELNNNPAGRTYTRAPKVWGEGGTGGQAWGPAEQDAESKEVVPEGEPDPKETLHVSEVAALQKINSDTAYPIDMPPFDEALLGGFSPGDLVVVAGQSGMGKTTVIQDWSVTLASGGQTMREKLPTLWFSYEVLARPIWQKFQTMGASEETPLFMPRFNETGDTEWVIDVIEKAIIKWGIKVVAIDHLGFLRAPKGNYANAADAVTHTVRALKRLAVKHGLIILLPVHVRKTASKVPDLNDIKDASGIAQEADTVFFIGREKDGAGLPTSKSNIHLVKNRKTGISVWASLDFQFGRYFFDPNNQKKAQEPVSSLSGGALPYSDF